MRGLIIILLLLCSVIPAQPKTAIPTQISEYLEQYNLKLTTKAEDAQKTGYILVMGTGKGSRLDAKRAATVSAQRGTAAILAEFPTKHGKATKRTVKTPTQTKTTVTGKVKQLTPVFSYYDSELKTMYLLMRKPLANHP